MLCRKARSPTKAHNLGCEGSIPSPATKLNGGNYAGSGGVAAMHSQDCAGQISFLMAMGGMNAD